MRAYCAGQVVLALRQKVADTGNDSVGFSLLTAADFHSHEGTKWVGSCKKVQESKNNEKKVMSRTLRCFVRPSPSRSSVPPLCHDPVDLVQQFSREWVVGHVGCHREFRAQRVQFNHPTPRAGRSFGPNSSGQGQGAGDSRHIDRRQRTPVPEKKEKEKTVSFALPPITAANPLIIPRS